MPCDKSFECPWHYFATVKQNANKSGLNGKQRGREIEGKINQH